MTSPVHRSILGASLIAALALVGCQAATEDPTPSATGSPSSESSASVEPSASATAEPSASASASPTQDDGVETSVFDLEAGDCFSTDSDPLVTVTVVDCESSHVYEAFAVFDHTAGSNDAYPGDDEILDYSDTECQVHFEDFVDFAYADSIWFITSVTPSAETWDEGDREIICTLNLEDESEVSGSAEGAGE